MMNFDWTQRDWLAEEPQPLTREDLERFAEWAREHSPHANALDRKAFERLHALVLADFKPPEEEKK